MTNTDTKFTSVQTSEKYDSAILDVNDDNASSSVPPPPYVKPSEIPPPLPPLFPETAQFMKDEEANIRRGRRFCRGPKHNRKRRPVCCFIFTAIGIVIAIMGIIYGINRARCGGLDPSSQPFKTYTFDGAKHKYANLDFQMHGGFDVKADIRFVQSSDSTGRINLKVASFQDLPAPLEQTTLDSYTFQIDSRNGAFSFFNWFSQPPACVSAIAEISLPTGNHESLTVETSGGPITFTDVTNSNYNKVDLSSLNDKISISGSIPAKTASFESSNGEINIVRVNNPSLNITVKASNGQVEMDEVTAAGVKIEAFNGKVEVENANVRVLDIQGHNGEVDIEHWTGSTLIGSSQNGKIELKITDEIKENINIQLTSGNGKVDVEMSSTYKGTFNLKTINGESKVRGNGINLSSDGRESKIGYKDTNSGSSITISTNNGEASLKFV